MTALARRSLVAGTASPINAATDIAWAPVKVGGVPFAITITSNGKTAQVTGTKVH